MNELLAAALSKHGIALIPALVGKPGHKGGNFKFERVLTDIRARLLGEKKAYCTTFFDFYGLPADFPGKGDANRETDMARKADCVLRALTKKLESALGAAPMRRFIPYIQMYEFEGLLFSHPEKPSLRHQPGRTAAAISENPRCVRFTRRDQRQRGHGAKQAYRETVFGLRQAGPWFTGCHGNRARYHPAGMSPFRFLAEDTRGASTPCLTAGPSFQ